MKKSIIIFSLFFMSGNLFAQKQTFDIVSYSPPKGWSEKQGDGNISYSRIDGASWAQIAIYQHRNCEGDIQTDFDKDWNELVAQGKNISSPEKTDPKTAEGWMVMSGSGVWQYNGANVASILTVYSNNTICVAVLCNATAQPYLKNYKELIGSLVLDANKIPEPSVAENNSNVSTQEANTNNLSNSSIVGIWVVNTAEDRGFINGFRMYTGGYIRKEYQIKENGTYIFREKNWLAANETIYFAYESGTWTMNGNKLIITPKNGKAGWWNKDKITNDVNKWGDYQKAAAYKIQTASYTLEIKIDPNYSNSIILNSNKATERDGGQFNNPPYRFVYVQRKETLIDNPPGFKLSEAASVSEKNILSNSANSILAGKIFESTSPEKSGSGNMQYNTGGYRTWQYQFNKDGTYRFVYVAASHFNEVKILQYETGTYSVNGDQLTISPVKGANEEWSKIGKTSNGNSDVSNRAINDTWNKLSKTSNRKLEKVTYPFSIQYLDANKANTLILQHHQATERDGSPGWDDSSYYYEISPGKSRLVLPTGFK